MLARIGFLLVSLLPPHLIHASQVSASPAQSAMHHSNDRHLRVSAIVHDPRPPHHARIECWEFDAPFAQYPTVGSFFNLANITNLTYVTLPPRSKEGIHHPPHPMLFILVSGLSHVHLPKHDSDNLLLLNRHGEEDKEWKLVGGADEEDGRENLWIVEGVNSIIVATDTLGPGHYTDYPGHNETVALQAPFGNGIVPGHKVIAQSACPMPEGWRTVRDDLVGGQ